MGFELGNDGPSVILVGHDGSRTASHAVAYAAGLARRQGSQLVVVHVSDPSAGVPDLTGQTMALREASRQEAAEQLRQEVLAGAASVGLSVEVVLEQGDPYKVLTQVARDRRVDAVVVGASEHAGHRLVGSLGVRLVRSGLFPVTVVP